MCQVRADNDKYQKLRTIVQEYIDKYEYCFFGTFALPRDDALKFIDELDHIEIEYYGYMRIEIDEGGHWHEMQATAVIDEYFDGTLQQLRQLSILNIAGGKRDDIFEIFFDGGPLARADFIY